MGDGDGQVNLDDALATMRETGKAMKTYALTLTLLCSTLLTLCLKAIQGDLSRWPCNQCL